MERKGEPWCSLTTGRGVDVIMHHPWSADRTVRFGRTKPKESVRRMYARFDAAPHKERRAWFVTSDELGLRRFVVESLLYYCVGTYVFRRRHSVSDSGAQSRGLDSFVEDYARKLRWRE